MRVCFRQITTVCCPLIESVLYPFGEDVGDSKVQINTEDGNSPYITPPIDFPFMEKLYDRIYVSLFLLDIICKNVNNYGMSDETIGWRDKINSKINTLILDKLIFIVSLSNWYHTHPFLSLCISFQITDLSTFSLSVRTNSTSFPLLLPMVSPATKIFLCWRPFGMMLTSPMGMGGCCIRLDRSDLSKDSVSHLCSILLLLLSFRSIISLIHQTCTPRRCSIVQQRK